MSSKLYRASVPLPSETLTALRSVYQARRLSARRLASSIGSAHPHVGRVIAGRSRPSVVLAARMGEAMDLPNEFTALMMEQSSKVGRKMRRPDGFGGVDHPVGETPCPLAMARCNELMHTALVVAGWGAVAREFNDRSAIRTVGIVSAMGDAVVVTGAALDPWSEFNQAGAIGPLVAWRGAPKPPYTVPLAEVGEFIASVPSDVVVRCKCHGQ